MNLAGEVEEEFGIIVVNISMSLPRASQPPQKYG